MSKFLHRVLVLFATAVMPLTMFAQYQLPDPGFEDWSGTAFDGKIQNKYWHASNVEQSALGMSFKFNFAHRETGRSGYCIMAQDQTVGAAGITETSPSYYSLGYGWQYLEGLSTGTATAGTKGGYAFTHRPDSISVWIKRTGSNTDKEDYHILFYSWTGTAKGTQYKNKNGGCTSVTVEDEESDIRQLLDKNECKTQTAGGQVAEGWWRERATYNNWTNIRIPIYYINDNVPAKCNVIFSASNYPNFRANSGLYEGNSLYVDDIELIYSSKIHKLEINGKEWKGFDPNNTGVQVYSVASGTTSVPTNIVAYRGVGSLTNPRGTTQPFGGRKLSGSEISIVNGTVGGTPTTITVTAEDGSSTTTYKILFQAEASANAKLATINYTYTDKNNQQQTAVIPNFNPSTYNYYVELPYGSKGVPTLTWETQEDDQMVVPTQATAVPGSALLKVIAPNGSSVQNYTINFTRGQLADNTLADIKVNGTSLPGFTPTQAVYRVSLPVSTSSFTVQAVSAYPAGEQTIVITPNPLPTGEAINGATVQISVTTPGNTVPKVYKLNLKLEASSYSYLQDLRVVKDGVNLLGEFESTRTTYYLNLPLGTTELPAISWTAGDEFQTIVPTPLGEGVVDGTYRVTVTAGNGDQTVYKIVFTTEKSDRSTLDGITIGGVALEGFDSDVLSYTYALPVGTTVLPEIVAIPGDEWQTVSVTEGGLNGKTRITVTAGNGNTTVYQIQFSVATYSDNTLKALYLDGVLIDGFAGDKDEYTVNLPQGTTTLPVVTFELQNDQLQTATVRDIKGLSGDYKITVRPQGGASRTYIIHFVLATSSNNSLEMIYLNGTPLAGFDPDTLHYCDSLPEGEGVSSIPAVTFTKGETSQRVLSVLEGKQQIITVTAESGAKRIYIIDFIVRASANAYLNMIYLDGDSLEGFDKEHLEYTVKLEDEICPAITVDKAPGQQVTITAPYAEGIARIAVKPEEGSGNTYTITFERVAPVTARLNGIKLDGTPIADFKADSMNYTATYSKQKPVITYTKQDASQKVIEAWKGNVAYLHVQDSLGNKAAYTVSFTHTYIGNNKLEAIYADGVLIDGFDPDSTNYHYTLNPGSDYPTLTYKTSDDAQVVYFGQLEEGKWGLSVVADNDSVKTYTVQYTVNPYTEVALQNLEVAGRVIAFDEDQHLYDGGLLGEGETLPHVTATPKKGQSVITFNENDSTQRVLVMAQDGATSTYTIQYTRELSNNVKLQDIIIEGDSTFVFNPNVLNYTVTLPHDAEIVPNVNAIPQLDNQTVTTYFSRPNGVTRIHVVAQDGSEGEYTIAFPIKKAEGTKLKSLKIDNIDRDVNTTEYTFNVPYTQIAPYDIAYQVEDGQLVRYVEAPLSGETKIIVTSESGENTRTYSIRYNVAQPQGENKVKSVHYRYVDADNNTVNGQMVPVPGENIIDLPFGAKSFDVIQVDTTFKEQSIYFYNGGIRRGATIIAASNRTGENDVTYTIVPNMLPDTIGKLKSLTFKGAVVPKFRHNVYNYIVNVTAQPTAADFVGVAYNGATVNKTALDNTKKQIKLTVEGGETYSVCWYYENDGKYLNNGQYYDYLDFSQDWLPTANAPMYKSSWTSGASASGTKSTGFKPTGWTVPADLAAGLEYDIDLGLIGKVVDLFWYSGKEVIAAGTNGALLSTINGASINGSIPGMMTIGGTMSLSPNKKGGSTSDITYNTSNFIAFRNTPDSLSMRYKSLSAELVTGWSYEVRTVVGSTTRTDRFDGNYSTKDWRYASKPITAYNGAMSKYAITINSAHTTNAADMSGSNDIYTSDLQIENIHFVYNSDLTDAKVNGHNTVKSGNTFTYTLGDNEVILGEPALKFTGKVHDQTQTIEWLNNGEWLNGELKAKVVNYGENAKDSTIYYVVLKRTPDTSLGFTASASFGTFAPVKNDTVFITVPMGTKQLPNLTVTPESVHQFVSMTKKGNAVTVNVKNENGNDTTVVYVFREDRNNISAPEEWGLESGALETVDGANLIYAVTANSMPRLYIVKNEGQLIDLNYFADSAIFVITSSDGTAQSKYTVLRKDVPIASNGKLEFTRGMTPWGDVLGGDKYEATGAKPAELITFVRNAVTDTVVYIQAPTKMEWQVAYGAPQGRTYVYNYPSALSANANLDSLLINGVPYSEFSDLDDEYTIYTDSNVVLTLVEAEVEQKIVTTQVVEEGNIVNYTATVTAPNDTTTRTYHIAVSRPKSNDATLAGILVDSVMIAGFDPNTTDYTVVLPSPAVKKDQPKMPSITYVANNAQQKVTLTIGELNGNPTELFVKAGDGSDKTYTVTVLAEPSACVDLTGITVNGQVLDQFESGRHFYSISLKTDEVEVDYTSDDAFQTVTTHIETLREHLQYRYTLNVRAENGDESNYEVMVYIENQSTDDKLANITLDGKNFEDFERALNPELVFDPGNNNYSINLISTATVLPEVSAQLKMDGQSVVITQKSDSILLEVTAADKIKHNIYTLRFLKPKSKNADLSMIFLDGDSLPDFKPETYFYSVELPVGVHELPELAPQKSEGAQLIEQSHENLQTTIKVLAEDTSYTATYNVLFSFTQSDVDTLAMIYQDGRKLEGYRADSIYYPISLEVGTTAFPDVQADPADEWQTVTINQLDSTPTTLIKQIVVTSESKRTRTYTVSYTIEKSNVDTLQMLFVDQKQLPGFKASITEYYHTLSASEATALNGQLPEVDFIKGDEVQTVMVSQAADSLSGKTLGYKSLVTVTAATGKTTIYTIHYPVELSNDATLNMINVGSKPLANYDAERYNYKLEIEMEAAVPVVSVIKKEEAQVYEINVIEDTVTLVDTVKIVVWAESAKENAVYTLTFEHLKSKVTDLRDIILIGADSVPFPTTEFPYRPDIYSYTVKLPFNRELSPKEQLPAISYELYNKEQVIDTAIHTLPNGDLQVDITVTAANGEDQAIYTITFQFVRPSDAMLASLGFKEQEFVDFRPSKTEYVYAHPYGTDSTDYFTAEDVTYVLSDSLAKVDTIFVDEFGQINVVTMAQDGKTSFTYIITQITAKDGDNALAWITVNDDTIPGFDPEVMFYTYYVFESDAPSINAAARSLNAEVDLGRVLAGDTCRIICTAADGTDRYYYIYFAITSIDPSAESTADDVLVKPLGASHQLFIATIRQGVYFALYDQYGKLVYHQPVPPANPNDVEIVTDQNGIEHVNNISNLSSGLLVDVIPGQIYYYAFYNGDKNFIQMLKGARAKRLQSGKIIIR